MNRRITIMQALVALGRDKEASAVLESAPTCLRFDTSPLEETNIPLGASKIGGLPDLFPEIDWPMYNEKPMSFRLQLNLSEVCRFSVCKPLPKSGWLHFFCQSKPLASGLDPTDSGTWRVIFAQGAAERLIRRGLPPDGYRHPLARSCRLTFYEDIDPDWPHTAAESLGLDGETLDRCYSFVKNIDPSPRHQVLGHPLDAETEQEQLDEAEAVEVEPDGEELRLLVQIDLDTRAGITQDAGRLFFWITQEELEQCAFEHVLMTVWA